VRLRRSLANGSERLLSFDLGRLPANLIGSESSPYLVGPGKNLSCQRDSSLCQNATEFQSSLEVSEVSSSTASDP
jgi:hypothetical protein